MVSRYCLRCGAAVPDDDLFCGKCGAPLTPPAPQPAPVANRFDPWASSEPAVPAEPDEPGEPARYAPNSGATQMLLISLAAALMISIGAAVFVLVAAGD
jgi:uncharacterized membrane protein YvbJ